MGRPKNLTWQTPISSGREEEGDTSASVKSEVIALSGCGGSLEISWTGTTAGTITLQAGNSHDPRKTNAVTGSGQWNGTFNSINALVSPPIVNPAGAAGSMLIDLNSLRCAFLYIDFVRTSGSGTIKASLQQPGGGLS